MPCLLSIVLNVYMCYIFGALYMCTLFRDITIILIILEPPQTRKHKVQVIWSLTCYLSTQFRLCGCGLNPNMWPSGSHACINCDQAAMHTLTYLITIQFQITPFIVSRVNFLCFPFVGLKIDLEWERTIVILQISFAL